MFRASWAESKEKETSCNTHRGFFLNREISFGGIISCRNKSEQSFLGFVSLKSVHLPSCFVSHHAMWLWWVDWEDFQPRAWSLIQFELTLIEHICAARAERGGRCYQERQLQSSRRVRERSLNHSQVGAVSTSWHGPPICLACPQLSYVHQPAQYCMLNRCELNKNPRSQIPLQPADLRAECASPSRCSNDRFILQGSHSTEKSHIQPKS